MHFTVPQTPCMKILSLNISKTIFYIHSIESTPSISPKSFSNKLIWLIYFLSSFSTSRVVVFQRTDRSSPKIKARIIYWDPHYSQFIVKGKPDLDLLVILSLAKSASTNVLMLNFSSSTIGAFDGSNPFLFP